MRRQTMAPEIAAALFLPKPRRNVHGEKLITVSRTLNEGARSNRDQTLPMIRMRGRWLQKLGFRSGARIVVRAEQNRIMLTVVRGEE